MKPTLRALVVGTAIGLCSLHANAQNAGAAQDLFDRGKAALLEKKYGDACPLLEESYRLDPAGGTLQNLAVCYEGLGKTGSAYARFQELKTRSKAATPPRADRIEMADEHIATLVPRLSRLEVVMPGDNRRAGAALTIDKVPYGPASWDGIVLDPGPHELEVTAPAHDAYRTQVTVAGEHVTLRVSVPTLKKTPVPVAVGQSNAGAPFRTAGFVTGGVGLGVALAGGIFGILAVTTNSAAERRCPESGVCNTARNDDANDLRGDARVFGNVANVAIPVGLVAAGVGAVLVWQGYRKDHRAAASAWRLAPSASGLSGSF